MTAIDSTTPAPTTGPKRKRIFMWTFIAVQLIFLTWLIAGIASAAHSIPAYCADPANSQYIGTQGCTDASQLGTAVGAGLVIGLWCVTDFILGVGRLVVVFARRGNR